MLTAATLIDRLVAAGIATQDDIHGCTAAEVVTIEQSACCVLPRAYIEFLWAVGRGAGSFLYDQEVFYPKMLGLNAKANEILDDGEGGSLRLPDRAFVFTMRYGEQFLFFIADGARDNPPCFHYYERHGTFQPVGTFWGFVNSELQLIEDFRRKWPDSPFLAQNARRQPEDEQ
jgi:hypothetical protein